ncbi:ATP-dependent RNA helicase MRH4, mitochondrial [Vanrija pseudolonga]|uniref:ATP-dependent RNA helicase n=1 Tax=Vanrija pseudolonga TaxID=143232 RepID=A0AAF0Y9C3_9TREE|nr:ATP-dependent RNA helicase MRH4, mitochondrial [Vanrija pseudolonga]
MLRIQRLLPAPLLAARGLATSAVVGAYTPRTSFGVKPGFASHERAAARDRPAPAGDRPSRDRPASTRPAGDRSKGPRRAPSGRPSWAERSAGATPKTTSQRLAAFPRGRGARDGRGEDKRDGGKPRTQAQREKPQWRADGRGGFMPAKRAAEAAAAPKVKPEYQQKANVELARPRKFASFGLHPGLLTALEERFGAKGETMPIQSLALSRLIDSELTRTNGINSHAVRAILGAETGSGKTLAYLLPLVHHLKQDDRVPSRAPGPVAPRAIVLQPTHELTRQSTAVAKGITHQAKLTVVGASSPGAVKDAGEVDVLFATGRTAAYLLGIPREETDTREKDESRDKKKEDKEIWEREEVEKRRRRPENDKPRIDLSRVEWVVIDEADVLLGPDFLPETAAVLAKLRAATVGLNILLVTATLPPSILRAIETDPLLSASEFTKLLSPGLHKLPKALETRFVPWSGAGNPLADVAHEIKRGFAEEAQEAKVEAYGIDNAPKSRTMAVVFAGSVSKVNSTVAKLEEKGIPCLAWTGESDSRVPGYNGAALDSFLVSHKRSKDPASESPAGAAKGAPRVLVTTSLLSRGLDFSPAVTTSYLIEPPRNVLDFVHRAGRTGRAGRPGRVVVFGMSHAGQSKYASELRDVLGKVESRPAVKPGGRSWSGAREARSRGGRGGQDKRKKA